MSPVRLSPVSGGTTYILQSKNRLEHSVSVYLDLSKAFDTLDHSILLQKLEKYGIWGIIKDWIEDYLKHLCLVAKITTSLNKVRKSNTFDITCGAAQGSCLGPLLFIIFVNDTHLLPLYSRLILFADDTTIFNRHRNSRYLQYMMETDLHLLSSWFNANKLSLNIGKTVGMKFWDESTNFHLRIDSQSVPLVKETKFLGVYIDNKLSWHYNINYIIDKLNNNRRLLHLSKNLLNTACKRHVYYGHLHSHMTYGVTVWGSMESELYS